MDTTTSAPGARISYDGLLHTVRKILRCDLEPTVIDVAARALVDGQALGNPRFGIGLLGQLDPEGDLAGPVVAEQQGGRIVLDGAECFGPLAMAKGAHILSDLVAEHGIAVVAVRSLAGTGRLAPFVEAVADQGALALACAASSPAVAPHGGDAPFVGTNPLAMAMPAIDGSPLVLDIASSATTMAEIHKARDEGYPLPEGVVIDSTGTPITDAAGFSAVLPRGGLIGTLVGMVVEGMTAGLSGEPPVNTARTVTMIAVRASPDAGNDLRYRLIEAGGREPGARARNVIAQAQHEGILLDPGAREILNRLTK